LQDVLVWPRRIGATCETDVNLQDVLDWALRSDVQR